MRNKYPNPSDAVAAILKAGTDIDVSLARVHQKTITARALNCARKHAP